MSMILNVLIMKINILASGPAHRVGTNRFLEKFLCPTEKNIKPLIDIIINACIHDDVETRVIINKQNYDLIDHIKKFYSNVHIILTNDLKMISTFKCVFKDQDDHVLVAADLIGLVHDDIKKFINTEYRCAIMKYKHRWAPHDIMSPCGKYIRRSDIGDAIFKIGLEYNDLYMSKNNQTAAKQFFKLFFPHNTLRENMANDIWTWMDYSFFYNIWSNPHCDEFRDIGVINFNKPIWEDND